MAQDGQDIAKKLSKMPKIIIILSIVSAVMVLAAGSFVWWRVDSDIDYRYSHITIEGNWRLEFTLNEVHQVMDSNISSLDEDQIYTLISNVKHVASVTDNILNVIFMLMIINIIPISLLMGTEKTLDKLKYIKKLANLSVIIVTAALILVIIAPYYYLIYWPEAVYEDGYLDYEDEELYDSSFEGSNKVITPIEEQSYSATMVVRSSWGPGFGWFYSILCIFPIIFTLGFVIIYGDRAIEMARSSEEQSNDENKSNREIEEISQTDDSKKSHQPPPPPPPPRCPTS